MSWWPFDGNARGIFGGLNGLLYGDVAFTNGEVGQAYYGDGVATKVVVPASPNLNLPSKYGLSIEGWINPANVSNSAPLVEWSILIPPIRRLLGVQLWLGNLSTTGSVPGALSAALRDTNPQTYYVFTGPQVLTNGGWQHVALTYDAGTRLADLYVNGRLAGTRRPLPAGTVLRGNGDVYLGFDPASSQPGLSYAGGLDEIRLYSRALSPRKSRRSIIPAPMANTAPTP